METITFAVKDVSNIIILLKKFYRNSKQFLHNFEKIVTGNANFRLNTIANNCVCS